MIEHVYEEHEVLIDFNFGNNVYFVELGLLLSEESTGKDCEVCNAMSLEKQKNASETTHGVMGVTIRHIREIKLCSFINLDSKDGLLVQKHINHVLYNPKKKLRACRCCFPFLWLLLDKK